MTATEKAINAIYQGSLVDCTQEEYQNGVRTAIQERAGKWIDSGDAMRASIALEEVRRLDKKFDL